VVAQQAVAFAMPTREAYNKVLERPPFSETRRPAPAGAAETASDQPIAATVIGTFLSSSGVRALITHGEPAQLARFVEGQEVEGWTIKSILQGKVVLTRGGSTIELKVKGNPTQASSPGTTSTQPANSGLAKPSSALLPPPPAKAPAANPSVAARSAEPDEAAPANDSMLSQMTRRVSRFSGAQGTSLRGVGRRGK
jgi:hypothetical protein